MLFQQTGSGMLQIAFIQAAVLRAYPQDRRLWRLVQISVLIVDIVLLLSLWDALSKQGRLNPVRWRGEDWTSIGITGVVAVIRLCFLADVEL